MEYQLLYLLFLDNNLYKKDIFRASDLLDLTKAQTLFIYEITNVIIINEYQNFVFVIF